MCLGVPGIITECWQDGGALLARGDFAGEERVIRLNYLPDLAVGDWVITHAGYALTRLTADDAASTLATMREVGLLPPAESAAPAPALAAPALAASGLGLPVALVTTGLDVAGEVCVTCSDEGRPGEVIAPPTELFAPATVRTATGEEEIDVTLVGDVAPGDLILIHAGMALQRLDATDFVGDRP
jgi:hydrogenase expression/formation protein HypC